MNVVESGGRYNVFNDNVKTYSSLPVNTYEVVFNKMTGFYLISRKPLELNIDKIYGGYEQKANKILNSFSKMSKNMGVILSGQKGCGKTLLAKLIAQKASAQYPIILVNSYMPGLASFIEEIDQPAIIIFDEFEKNFKETFGNSRDHADEPSRQEELLTLFEGVLTGKKLFIITCNESYRLNEFFIDRPGRFHYHFKMNYVSSDIIKDYLKDNLSKEYLDIIPKLIALSSYLSLTYDCLQAIVFELNNGYSLEETLEDLNIPTVDSMYVNVSFKCNGATFSVAHQRINFKNRGTIEFWMRGEEELSKYREFCAEVAMDNLYFENGRFYVHEPKKNLRFTQYTADDSIGEDILTKINRDYSVENIDFNSFVIEKDSASNTYPTSAFGYSKFLS